MYHVCLTVRGFVNLSLAKYFWFITSRRMKWTVHMSRMGERESTCRILVEKSEGKGYLKDIAVDGMIILKRTSKNSDGRAWTGLIWLRIETFSDLS
jgi:hypothetical protein